MTFSTSHSEWTEIRSLISWFPIKSTFYKSTNDRNSNHHNSELHLCTYLPNTHWVADTEHDFSPKLQTQASSAQPPPSAPFPIGPTDFTAQILLRPIPFFSFLPSLSELRLSQLLSSWLELLPTHSKVIYLQYLKKQNKSPVHHISLLKLYPWVHIVYQVKWKLSNLFDKVLHDLTPPHFLVTPCLPLCTTAMHTCSPFSAQALMSFLPVQAHILLSACNPHLLSLTWWVSLSVLW